MAALGLRTVRSRRTSGEEPSSVLLIPQLSVSALTLMQICRESTQLIIVLPTCLNVFPIYIIKTFLVTSCPCFQVGSRFIRSLGRALHPLSRGKAAFWMLSGHKTAEGIIHLLVLLETLHVAKEIPLFLVFLACLMQPRDNISRTFLLPVEKSGLMPQHPTCLISVLQSRPILESLDFWAECGRRQSLPICYEVQNLEFKTKDWFIPLSGSQISFALCLCCYEWWENLLLLLYMMFPTALRISFIGQGWPLMSRWCFAEGLVSIPRETLHLIVLRRGAAKAAACKTLVNMTSGTCKPQ